MTAATIVESAALEGIELRVVNGELQVLGDRATVDRWLPVVRACKADILTLLEHPASTDRPNFSDLRPAGCVAGGRNLRPLVSLRLKAVQQRAKEPNGNARNDDRPDGGTGLAACPGTSEDRAYRWLIRFGDWAPIEVAFSLEATHGEVLELQAESLAAEPITMPQRPAIPLSAGERHRLRAWLDSIGETDLAVRAAVAEQCERDPAARRYYFELVPTARADDRRHCRECANLTTRGVCIAARSIGAREGYQPTDDMPRRCEAFRAPEAEA